MAGVATQAPSPADAKVTAGQASPFFCKSVPPMPDPWRQPNACDDLIGLHPERVAFIKQQESHFISRVRFASLRPQGIYGPGLLSNTLPHQTKFFCLHQPLPPLPIPEAHRYHRFTLVDLLEHDTTDTGEQINEDPGFFSSIATTTAGGGGSPGSSSSAITAEKTAKSAAAAIASFLLSAAPAAELGPHAFRKVAMQQPHRTEQASAPPGSGLLRSFSAQSLRQQHYQQQHGGGSLVGAASSVSSRTGGGRPASQVSTSSQRQVQQQPYIQQQQQQYTRQQQYTQQQYTLQQPQQQQQVGWGVASDVKQEKKRKTKRRKVEG